MNLSLVRFPGKHDGEAVIAVYHRHWFDIFSSLLIPVLLSIVVIGAFITLPFVAPVLFRSESEAFFTFLENSFLLFFWLNVFLIWIDLYFDVWIVTDERIINIEQKDLFTRRVSELRFSRVQDVTSEVTGVIPSILNFGDVYVQTAGENPRFIFHNVSNPIAIKDLVMRLAEKRRATVGSAGD
ncbi:MAG: PH domain-containing protein [Candidatus Moranbacteria bacterium]|nr:PH domain-containing protein [Candidatus Moranbacteria bacterium]